MTRLSRNLLRAASCLPAFVAGWYFLRARLAPDACLDFGGSFDYVAWRCSYAEDHVFIDVPAYHFVSFWLLLLGLIFALVAFVWLRPRRNAA